MVPFAGRLAADFHMLDAQPHRGLPSNVFRRSFLTLVVVFRYGFSWTTFFAGMDGYWFSAGYRIRISDV